MAEKRKKETLLTKNNLTIAGIILSIGICGACFFSDLHDNVKKANINDIMKDPTFRSVASKFNKFGKVAVKARHEVIPVIEKGAGNDTPKTLQSDKGTVVRVIDGDTYALRINNEEETVRLIGVNTPESVAPIDYSKKNTEEGKEVSEFVKEKIKEGDTLSIKYDIVKTDNYGRILAYLYFKDGKMVQEWLLENGYAQCMTVQPNSKYADKFAEIQHTAAENKVGFWNGFFKKEE